MQLKHRTDWLGFNSVFYSKITNEFSYNINDVIATHGQIDLDTTGIYYYFKYGYCVFGRTPIKGIFFTPACSDLVLVNGRLFLEEKDPVVSFESGYHTDVRSVLQKISHQINQVVEQSNVANVLPLSAGYDSRLLLSLIKNQKNVHCFTYGVSSNQLASKECVFAKETARLLKSNWNPVWLGDFHQYIPDYYNLFGVSTHLHGMYHFEFYKKIKNELQRQFQVLSGIIGDIWSGNVRIPRIKEPADVSQLGKCSGIQADMRFAKIEPELDLEMEYLSNAKDRLVSEESRIIELVRFKIMLLKYLMLVPQSMGLQSWSPFLNVDVATSILSLDPALRHNRKWQVDYFKQIGIFVDDLPLNYSHENSLDLQAQARSPLPKLDTRILSPFFDAAYLNHCMQNADNVPVYNSIVTLLPIQKLLSPLCF